ncbi:MAG: hypothetical protein GF368_05900 [Candidatus Aenigmarchaeota archaeon]|nr:hypothetical protein [Candidatus Aenigmarchaeota archaeon]
MNNKGVSAIIATIILLMITIALAGTAYIYMSGMIGGRTNKAISLLDASCSGTTITLVVSNDGTVDIDGVIGGGDTESDLRVFVDNTQDTEFNFGTIEPHQTGVSSDFTGNSGANTVLVVSPSNSVRQVVYC